MYARERARGIVHPAAHGLKAEVDRMLADPSAGDRLDEAAREQRGGTVQQEMRTERQQHRLWADREAGNRSGGGVVDRIERLGHGSGRARSS